MDNNQGDDDPYKVPELHGILPEDEKQKKNSFFHSVTISAKAVFVATFFLVSLICPMTVCTQNYMPAPCHTYWFFIVVNFLKP